MNTDTTILSELEAERQEALLADRRAWLAGIRELADFIEAHPDLPCPSSGAHLIYCFTKAQLVDIARVRGVRWQKDVREGSEYFSIKTTFTGGHAYEAYVDRVEVCRKVVTGTVVVPATPEHVEETFKWECSREPLLAPEGAV
jgi:hypothetical protein